MSPTPASHTLTDEQLELWQRVHELWELSSRRDAPRIRDALHPDYMGWDMRALLPHDREAAVQSVSGGESASLVRYDLQPLSVRVYGGSAGVVHYRYNATVASKDGQHIPVSGRWTEIYVKEGPRWLMVAVSGKPGPP